MIKINKKSKISILVFMGSGGHSTQMLKLVDLLNNDHDYIYVIPKSNRITEKKIKIKGEIYKITSASLLTNTAFHNSITALICLFESLVIIIKTKPKIIISSGPITGLILSLIGKLFGSKIVFIESWSRVTSLSHAGEIAYKLVDLFFIQWEELKEKYPKSLFEGRLG